VKSVLVRLTTQEEFNFLFDKQKAKSTKFKGDEWNQYKNSTIVEIKDGAFYMYGNDLGSWSCDLPVYTYKKYCLLKNYTQKDNTKMKDKMLDILTKTYNNPVLRQKTVPLFMSNPGVGKTTIIKEFVQSIGVKMVKITLSQRMPNEVVGMVMPVESSGKLVVYDSHELSKLEDGDILFFDEAFNGTLKQTLDAVLNLLEDRMLPSGKKLANVMIVAASNPQGLINLTPQIKERFIRYDLDFNEQEYQDLLQNKYGMPLEISRHLCTLINKEKFDNVDWHYLTPRSIEKAINQIGCNLHSPYEDLLLPFLSLEVELPTNIESLNAKQGENIKYLDLLKVIIKKYNDNKN